ncbi:MAG: HlyD family efflux transporter periplasmic adaptor subunit [Burkholderiaceae bacterium]
MNRPRLIPLLLMLACGPSIAAPGDMDCLIQPHQVIQVGSPVPGVIGAVGVERGDEIHQGQVIASLQAEVEQAALRLARARARSEAELVAAAQSGSLRGANWHGQTSWPTKSSSARPSSTRPRPRPRSPSQDAAGPGAPAPGPDRTGSGHRAAGPAHDQVAIDGIVIDRFLSVGEYVDDRPVARIAQIDLLRVEVVVPASLFGRIRPGQVGTVTPDDGSGDTLQASVSVVDRIVDAASGTFGAARAAQPQGRIAPGLRCQVRLADDIAAEPATPAAAPVAATRG